MNRILRSCLAAVALLLLLTQPAFAQTLNTPPSQYVAAASGSASVEVNLGVTGGLLDIVSCVLADGSAIAADSPCTLPCGPNVITCASVTILGASISSTFTITVQCAPQLSCPTSAVVQACTGNGAAAVAFSSQLSATDYNGESLTSAIVCSSHSGASFGCGTTAIECSVTDSCAAVSSCNFNVEVTDTIAPIIACPNLAAGNCPLASPQVFTATATDACWPASEVSVSCTPASDAGTSYGSTSVTCTATDKGGNKDTCSFTYEVTDTTPPTIACPSNIVKSVTCASTASYTLDVTASDSCGVKSLACTLNGSASIPATGAYAFPIGVSTISCTATNEAGLKATESFTVTVNNVLPSITCPANIQTECVSKSQAAVSYSIVATETTTGDLTSQVSCSAASGSYFALGSTNVECNVCGASCSFSVEVQDTAAPVITCPSYPAATCPAEQAFTATAIDTCTGAAVPATCTPSSFTSQGAASQSVVCSATDSSNIAATCSFTYEVEDKEAPVLSCPTSLAATATCSPTASVAIDVTATDNCVLESLQCAYGSKSLAAVGSYSFPIGTSSVSCTATDKSGLSATQSFDVVVTNKLPTITCPANIISQCQSNGQSAVEYSVVATETTTGDLNSQVSCSAASGSYFAMGATTVDCSVCGATCSFTITVQDTTAPTITCPNLAAAECPATQTFTATAVDACSGSNVAVSCTPADYDSPAAGTTAVVCTAIDSYNNKASCNFNYVVQDNTPPVLSLPAPITTSCTCATEQAVTLDISATDECVLGTVACSMGSTSIPLTGSYSFPLGTSTVSCTATDKSGLAATGSYTVTVNERLPTMVCPSDISIAGGLGGKIAVPYSVVATNVQTGDLNSQVTCSDSAGAISSGSTFEYGTTSVTCTVCSATCSFNVKVTNTPPVITCPAPITLQCSADDTAVGTYSVAATDVQDGNIASKVTCNQPSGAYYDLGSTPISCSVTDSEGASSSCSFSITVVDTTPPVLTCPTASAFSAVQCQANNQAELLIAPTVWDNCACDASLAVSCSPNVFAPTAFAYGTTTVSCSATDLSKNSATCSFPVTVIDTLPPILSSNAGSITMCADGNLHNITASECGIKAYDVCDGKAISLQVTGLSADESIAANTDAVVSAGYLQLLATTTSGNGRIYSIKFSASDSHGNVASGICSVNIVTQAEAIASGTKLPVPSNTASLSFSLSVAATLGI